jgi:hypothetical protein
MSGADILRGMVVGDAMTEDELLAGITEALTFGGWVWTHVIRSDGVTMGRAGLPDIIAAHADRPWLLAWELKSQRGAVSYDQLAWLFALKGPGIDVRVVRPEHYDRALDVILRGYDPAKVWPVQADPA